MKSDSRAELARRIELVCPDAAPARGDVEKLCADTRSAHLFGVCVPGSRVELARTLLEDTEFKVIALVGFPYGSQDSDVKRYETEAAIDMGAQELEAVIDIGRVRDGDYKYVLRELRDIVEAAEERPVKAVLEMTLLSPEQLRLTCELMLDSGIQGVCTSAGLTSRPTIDQVRELRGFLGDKFIIKAAGLIENTLSAVALVEAGADRLGTSHSLALLDGLSSHPPLL